jgi:glycine/D-amino acid oxidase-like deaminating enzyme
MTQFDAVVVGGGLVGTAIAHGLTLLGHKTAILDEGDVAFRASRGNFGLVWVQSKGLGMPGYAAWTRQSADLWPDFAEDLKERTDIDVGYTKPGGVHICFSDEEMAARQVTMEKLQAAVELPGFQFTMMDHKQLADMLPGLGPEVAGGSYCPNDGHCSPLALLHALHRAFAGGGGRYLPNHHVSAIRMNGAGIEVDAAGKTFRATRLILAAGVANAWMAPTVGIPFAVKPSRGQILVSEKLVPILPMPTTFVRQTPEGSFIFGDSHEDVGLDDGTSVEVMGEIARHGIRVFPFLAKARVVRVWGALRPMPLDGFPIYARSKENPNVYAIGNHSGVTLAAVHVHRLARWIAGEDIPNNLDCFTPDRFDV